MGLDEETGHCLVSVGKLRWEDIDFVVGVVTWRAEFDKVEHAHSIPLSEAMLAALNAERARRGAIAGWAFSARDGSGRALPRRAFYDWSETQRDRTGVYADGAFHALRRTSQRSD